MTNYLSTYHFMAYYDSKFGDHLYFVNHVTVRATNVFEAARKVSETRDGKKLVGLRYTGQSSGKVGLRLKSFRRAFYHDLEFWL